MLLLKSLKCQKCKTDPAYIFEIRWENEHTYCKCIFCGLVTSHRHREYKVWITRNAITNDENICRFILRLYNVS